MNTRPDGKSSDPRFEPNSDRQSAAHRAAWLCLPVMLALSAAVLMLFGVSWWTALIVIVLLACPAAAGTAMYFGLLAKSA